MNISSLPAEEKRATWRAIQQERPQLANLIKDPDFQAFCDSFDADIYLNIDTLPLALVNKNGEQNHG